MQVSSLHINWLNPHDLALISGGGTAQKSASSSPYLQFHFPSQTNDSLIQAPSEHMNWFDMHKLPGRGAGLSGQNIPSSSPLAQCMTSSQTLETSIQVPSLHVNSLELHFGLYSFSTNSGSQNPASSSPFEQSNLLLHTNRWGIHVPSLHINSLAASHFGSNGIGGGLVGQNSPSSSDIGQSTKPLQTLDSGMQRLSEAHMNCIRPHVGLGSNGSGVAQKAPSSSPPLQLISLSQRQS